MSPTQQRGVIVIGAGPAGAMAAICMARAGVSVTLVERSDWPREKVCGGCLNAAALAVLDANGLGDLPKHTGGRPLHELRLSAGSRRATITLPRSMAVSRCAFDAAMVEATVDAGVRFEPRTSARVLAVEPAAVELRGPGGVRVCRPDVVIVADGIAGRSMTTPSRVAPWSRMGAGAILPAPTGDYPSGAIHMSIGRGGYVGVVRLDHDTIDVAAALDPAYIRSCASPGAAAAAILEGAGNPPIEGLVFTAWRGTPLLTRRRDVAEGHVFVVGDAAGYVEPFTGEGIGWALRGAVELSTIAGDAAMAGVTERHRMAWRRDFHRATAARHQRCRWLSRLLRQPTMAAMMTRTINAAPLLGRAAARLFGGGPVRMHPVGATPREDR